MRTILIFILLAPSICDAQQHIPKIKFDYGLDLNMGEGKIE